MKMHKLLHIQTNLQATDHSDQASVTLTTLMLLRQGLLTYRGAEHLTSNGCACTSTRGRRPVVGVFVHPP